MQIQRIQTLYIFLAMAAMALFAFMPYGVVTHVAEEPVYAEKLLTLGEWGLLIPVGAAAVLLLIDIFLFRNLPQQRSVLTICLLLTLCAVAVVCFTLFKQADSEGIETMFSLWDILLPLAAAFEILALSAIAKDQKLLSSYNRLR